MPGPAPACSPRVPCCSVRSRWRAVPRIRRLPRRTPPAATAHCLPDAGGYLRAQLRGAINADLDWHDADIHCEGGPRPDGEGLRVSIAGPLPAIGRSERGPHAALRVRHRRRRGRDRRQRARDEPHRDSGERPGTSATRRSMPRAATTSARSTACSVAAPTSPHRPRRISAWMRAASAWVRPARSTARRGCTSRPSTSPDASPSIPREGLPMNLIRTPLALLALLCLPLLACAAEDAAETPTQLRGFPRARSRSRTPVDATASACGSRTRARASSRA